MKHLRREDMKRASPFLRDHLADTHICLHDHVFYAHLVLNNTTLRGFFHSELLGASGFSQQAANLPTLPYSSEIR